MGASCAEAPPQNASKTALGTLRAPQNKLWKRALGPKSAPTGPTGPPDPPPGRPKMFQNATEQFKAKPLGAPGRPQSRRRGFRKQFGHDFWPSRPLFFERSGLRFRSSQGTKPTTPLTTRKRIHPTRRAGGVIPEWPLASLGGPGEPKSDFKAIVGPFWDPFWGSKIVPKSLGI